MDGAVRTCKALKAHGAQHLVLIDSISPRRAPTAGRAGEAEQMDQAEWSAFRDRIATVAKMGAEDYGLTVGIHAHAAGFMDFEPELERLLDEVDEKILKICFDTGHHSYAGFDPVSLHEAPYQSHFLHAFQGHRPGCEGRWRSPTAPVSTMPAGKASSAISATAMSISRRCGRSCSMHGFEGWCTVEQDCDPTLDPDTLGDATANRAYLKSIGF
jgi:inosose dehydratase